MTLFLRYIELTNGLRALLISDYSGASTSGDEESDGEGDEEEGGEGEEEEGDSGEGTEEESEEEEDEKDSDFEDLDDENEGKRKKGHSEKQVMI